MEPFLGLIFLRISPRTGRSVLLFFSQGVVLLWSRSTSSRKSKWSMILIYLLPYNNWHTVIKIYILWLILTFIYHFLKFQYAWDHRKNLWCYIYWPTCPFLFGPALSFHFSVCCFSKWLMGSPFCTITESSFYSQSYTPGKYPNPLAYF